MSELSKITSISDSGKRVKEYKQYCSKLLKSGKKDIIVNFASELINSNDTVACRPTLQHLATELSKKVEGENLIDIAKAILDTLGKRSSSFVESAGLIRVALSKAYENEEEYTLAAKELGKVKIDTKPIGEQIEINVHIAQLYLEDEKPEFATTFVNKASQWVKSDTDINIRVKYLLCQARLYDYNHKFIDACRSYYQISHLACDEDVADALRSAVITCILAPAGPQRSRMLGILFKDERTHELEIFKAMQKMYLGRIVRANEETYISKHLLSHHKAETSDSEITVLKQALIEHNLEAASKIYNNITFNELGNLLGIKTEKSEKIAAKMISENRLKGYLDQVDEILYFEEKDAILKNWDEQIERICLDVDEIVSSINHKHAKLF